jgi:hypothetical protein
MGLKMYLKEYTLNTPHVHIGGVAPVQVREWYDNSAVFLLYDGGGALGRFMLPNSDRAWLCMDAFSELPEKSPTEDMVNHPPHYQQLAVEVKDIIKMVLEKANLSPYESYCLGNELKYRLRAGDKGDAMEDLGKAQFYRRERKADKD